jgi:hypothetical protein
VRRRRFPNYPNQPQSAAGVDSNKDVRDDCKKFLQLVARFGTDGKPLVMVKDVESAMDAATF